MKLNDREWGEFEIGKLFEVEKGTYLNQKDIKEGNLPYITAKATTNGLNDFIGNNKLFKGNNLTVEKIKLTAFYQPSEYWCSHDVSVLNHPKINKYNALFISSLINKQGEKYSYGRQAQMNIIKKQKILLPIDRDGEPDWMFMEEYSKRILQNKKQEYLNYIQKQIDELEYKEVVGLDEVRWEGYEVGRLFEMKSTSSGIDGNKIKDFPLKEKLTPYITRTDLNNGIKCFVQKEQETKYGLDGKNVITIGLDTQTVFYQAFKFYTGQNLQILKNENLNKFNSMLIINSLNIQMKNFSWGGNGATLTRLKRQKILLPTKNGSPDWEYMEQYAKNMIYMKLKWYLEYIEKT